MNSTLLKDLSWGNSVALAWTWGYGTYLSIQIALAFGFYGLLLFCIPNATGLALFGVLNHRISKQLAQKNINFEEYFFEKTKKYTPAFIIFQFLALSINAYGFIRYVAIPLGYSPVLALGLLFVIPLLMIGYGRTSNIRWIQLFLGTFVFSMLIYLAAQWNMSAITLPLDEAKLGLANAPPLYLIGWSALTIFSLIFAPWLDIQHWQRAVQIQKNNANLSRSYIFGGILFFMIIFFHGCAALYLKLKGVHFINEAFIGDQISYRTGMITHWANEAGIIYVLFLFLLAISSIASSLAGFRWYLFEKTQHTNRLNIFLLYIAGFVMAYAFALLGWQEEAYVTLFTFFIPYVYSIFWILYDTKNELHQEVEHKTIFRVSLVSFIIIASVAAYINTLSGMALLLVPFLILLLLLCEIKKIRHKWH